MAQKPAKNEWRRFYESLPPKGRFHVLTAVFCIFAPFSLLWNMTFSGGAPWYLALVWATYSGLVAVGWVYAVSRTYLVLLFVVPASFVLPAFFGRGFWAVRPTPLNVVIEHFMALILIMAGYILFVRFISKEGIKSLRHRAEIALAEEIHANLVPAIDLETDGMRFYGASDPTTEVGGDLLDVVKNGSGADVFVADVTGHGVPAGVLMGMVKSAVRMRLRSEDDLARLFGDLNRVVFEVQKPGMFVTLVALRFGPDRRVDYALAGHHPVLHWRKRTGALERHDSAAPPLGVLEDFPYQGHDFKVESGDLIVVLTDGLTEVFDVREEEFGLERFERLVIENAERPLPEIHDLILHAVREHGAQDDDQTLLLARVL